MYGKLHVDNSEIVANGSEQAGGGIYVSAFSELEVAAGTQAAQIARNTAAVGGGIYTDSTTTLHSAELVENHAETDGGGIFTTDHARLETDNVLFSGNTAGNGSYPFALELHAALAGTHGSNIRTTRGLSHPHAHDHAEAAMALAYNNYDINYDGYAGVAPNPGIGGVGTTGTPGQITTGAQTGDSTRVLQNVLLVLLCTVGCGVLMWHKKGGRRE